jgi:pimeloyl-ACP methyl ester carboxylesterase
LIRHRSLRAVLCLALSLAAARSGVAARETGQDLAVSGGRLWFEHSHTAQADTIVLLHDGLLHSVTWDQVWPALTRMADAIRYDRRGMGRSDSASAPFTQTDDLRALLDHEGVARATLVGSSSGSALALDFAIQHPERVERLVLIGPVLHGMPSSEHFLHRGELNNRPLDHGDVRAAARKWSEDRYQIAGPNPQARLAVLDALLAYPRNLTNSGRFERHFAVPAASRAHELRAPTLILVGESDIADVQAYAGAIEAEVPGARREVVTGAGHLIQLEQPDSLVRRLARFIAATPRVAVDSARVREYAGRYARAWYGFDVDVGVREGRLWLHVPTERDRLLFPTSDSTFSTLVDDDARAAFARGASGRVDTLDLTLLGSHARAGRTGS